MTDFYAEQTLDARKTWEGGGISTDSFIHLLNHLHRSYWNMVKIDKELEAIHAMMHKWEPLHRQSVTKHYSGL